MPLVVARGVAFHTQELGRGAPLPANDPEPRRSAPPPPEPGEPWLDRVHAAGFPLPPPMPLPSDALGGLGRLTPIPPSSTRAVSAFIDTAPASSRAPVSSRSPMSSRCPRAGLVMLHGLLVGSLASWYFTAAPALAQKRRVLLYDLRGHGRSERTSSGYDLGTMTGDLGALAARFDEGPLDLVGHSYGALIALRFALDNPGRVRRLVLVEAPLPPSQFHELEEFSARSPSEIVAALPDGLRDVMGQGGRRAARMIDSLDFLANRSTLFADLNAEPDDVLATLACPLLCIYGDRSSCRSVGERLARVVPGARLTVLSGGHYLQLDAREALTQALVEFLDS